MDASVTAAGRAASAGRSARGLAVAVWAWVVLSLGLPLLLLIEEGVVPPMVELRYVRRDGSIIDVQAQGIPVEVKGRRVVHVSVMDISGRKRVERSLRENEERFRALTELSSDWYWEQDEEFRFTSFAGASFRDYPQLATTLIGQRRWDSKLIVLSAEKMAAHQAICEAHQAFRDFEYKTVSDSGKVSWLTISGGSRPRGK